MTDALRAFLNDQAEGFEDSVRQALEIEDGDPRAAIRMLVVSNFLHEEIVRLRAQISTGFTRG